MHAQYDICFLDYIKVLIVSSGEKIFTPSKILQCENSLLFQTLLKLRTY